ncbi:MAG: hypothetical protein VKJ04_09660 [Vampirovibrionales bacterium]|nr:hypothetical protein [Vampirovibrionales bacterium]
MFQSKAQAFGPDSFSQHLQEYEVVYTTLVWRSAILWEQSFFERRFSYRAHKRFPAVQA